MKNRLVDMQENHVNMQRNYVGVRIVKKYQVSPMRDFQHVKCY